jgi:hypothetical protein
MGISLGTTSAQIKRSTAGHCKQRHQSSERMSDMIALMYYCTKGSCPSLKRKQNLDVEVEGEKVAIPAKGGAVEILLWCTHNLEDELVLAFCPCIYE